MAAAGLLDVLSVKLWTPSTWTGGVGDCYDGDVPGDTAEYVTAVTIAARGVSMQISISGENISALTGLTRDVRKRAVLRWWG